MKLDKMKSKWKYYSYNPWDLEEVTDILETFELFNIKHIMSKKERLSEKETYDVMEFFVEEQEVDTLKRTYDQVKMLMNTLDWFKII